MCDSKKAPVNAEECTEYTVLSLVEFAELKIDESKTLLGDRWLCRGCVAMIVAPSGQGKSTMSIQASALWSCGKAAFGISTPHALGLRILIVQAEDDDGDVTEMSRVVDHLGLTAKQRDLVAKNTFCVRVNTVSGTAFHEELDFLVKATKPDLVVLNPLNAYIGDDDKDQKAVMQFRNGINRLMNQYNSGTLIIHHTPKTNFNKTDDYGASDWQYRGAGSALLTNWARAMIVIAPAPADEKHVYRFIAAKRTARIGWNGTFERWFKHCGIPGVLRWDETPIVEKPKKTQPSGADPDKILELVPAVDCLEQSAIIVQASQKYGKGYGRDNVKIVLNALASEGKIHRWYVKEEGKKGAANLCWGKTEQPACEVEAAEESAESAE